MNISFQKGMDHTLGGYSVPSKLSGHYEFNISFSSTDETW